MSTLLRLRPFWPLLWMAALSLLALFLMRTDKTRSGKRGARRVPERTFFLLALLGGSPGVLWGMLLFRHKTLHWYFTFFIPLILMAQVSLVTWLMLR